MIIRTGRHSALLEAMPPPPTTARVLPVKETTTMKITVPDTLVHCDIGTAQSSEWLAWNFLALTKTAGKYYRSRSGALALSRSPVPVNMATPFATRIDMRYGLDVALDDYKELIVPASRLGEIYTTLSLRESFAQDCAWLATETENAHYKIAALKAYEALFLSLFEAKRLEAVRAERIYAKYEALASRIWRGGTPGETRASYFVAMNLLRKECTTCRDTERS